MDKEKRVLINFKMLKSQKEELELASKMSGLSMTSIILNGALKEAKQLMRDIERGKR